MPVLIFKAGIFIFTGIASIVSRQQFHNFNVYLR